MMATASTSNLKLGNGSRVAVVGAGPAGSFFSYFLLDMAQRAGTDIQVDIYEPHDFDQPGPIGCNMCGGIVSESLVQMLATEGINLPLQVVERGIDSYVLHMPEGSVRIETPLHEKRIAAVHRGAGPRGVQEIKWRSFDGYLLELALNKGARRVRGRVDDVALKDDRVWVKIQGGEFQAYDLLAVATGKNTSALKIFERLNLGYKPPRTTKTYICEIFLGEEAIAQYLGSSMHVFLLNLPRLEFAALIPKGDYATMCLLGHDIDRELVRSFVESLEVKQCLPPNWQMPVDLCHCSPPINIRGAAQPFTDRMVFIGDCGVTRLYKDGIGAAYRTAKAAAVTAIFEGISAKDFHRRYWPVCRRIAMDNVIGKFIFAVSRLQQKQSHDRRGILRMVADEQKRANGHQRTSMSMFMWDLFTGSAPYTDIFQRTLNPFFWGRLIWAVIAGSVSELKPFKQGQVKVQKVMAADKLGKAYLDGEIICHQGDVDDCMYVVQTGQVEVVQEKDGKEVRLAVRGKGEFFGEMAIVEREVRMATVRALGEAYVLTIDKRTFLRRVHEDPSLAYRIVQRMSNRIRELSAELIRVKTGNG